MARRLLVLLRRRLSGLRSAVEVGDSRCDILFDRVRCGVRARVGRLALAAAPVAAAAAPATAAAPPLGLASRLRAGRAGVGIRLPVFALVAAVLAFVLVTRHGLRPRIAGSS